MRARDPYRPAHGSDTFHVEHYDLELTYRVAANRLSGTATLRLRPLEQLSEISLDLNGFAVENISVIGARLGRYRHRARKLVVKLADDVPAGSELLLTVRYAGNPKPVPSPWGPLGWEELEDGALVASQPTGASSWFPCNDHPADKATYRTALTVDSPYFVLAHGVLTSRRARAATTTWVYEEHHPTSAYLATVQIGPYEELSLATSPVPQRAVLPPSLKKAARARLGHHGKIMRTFTKLFGPYPFASYSLVVTPDELEIPVEALGVSIFGSNHLADEDDQRLVPHELAHQWFGNSVSVTSWQHIWLNEGFACYAEWLWSEAAGDASADALARLWHARLAVLDQDLVLSDPGPGNIFDDRVYKRGALTLHALRRAFGDEPFFALVRDWTTRHRYSAVDTDDFRDLVEEHAALAGGEPLAAELETLLSRWLDSAELPELWVSTGTRLG
jgi:aminopeptidase N